MGAVTIEVKYTSIAKISLNPSPSVIQPALRALCAESAKAVTGRRCPHSGWGGGRLFDGSTKFFYENCSNSATESRKIDPKVGN